MLVGEGRKGSHYRRGATRLWILPTDRPTEGTAVSCVECGLYLSFSFQKRVYPKILLPVLVVPERCTHFILVFTVVFFLHLIFLAIFCSFRLPFLSTPFLLPTLGPHVKPDKPPTPMLKYSSVCKTGIAPENYGCFSDSNNSLIHERVQCTRASLSFPPIGFFSIHSKVQNAILVRLKKKRRIGTGPFGKSRRSTYKSSKNRTRLMRGREWQMSGS